MQDARPTIFSDRNSAGRQLDILQAQQSAQSYKFQIERVNPPSLIRHPSSLLTSNDHHHQRTVFHSIAMTDPKELTLSVKAISKKSDGTTISDMINIPQLAFGCYKVPDNEKGEEVLRNALIAGYRHFDTASFYRNEATLGRVLRDSQIPRKQLFLSSKVWNDAQKQGRAAVRASVLQSLQELNFGDNDNSCYWDLFLVHWPVPGHFIETYRELELLQQEGKIKAIGLSNFSVDEYEALLKAGIQIPPVLNQFEVSPFMYRPDDIQYFQSANHMVVAASKAMHRGGAMDNNVLQTIAKAHNVTPAQVMVRWSIQKKLVVLTMSSSLDHQRENRQVSHFLLSAEEVAQLDALTTNEAVQARTELEKERKIQL